MLRFEGNPINSDFCARAPSGHAAAALPSSVMNARRFIDRTAFDPTSQG